MSVYYDDYLDRMREFENNIKVSFSSLFPIEYSNYRVEGTNIKVNMPDLADVKTFQDAKLQKQTLLADVSADISIAVDGKVSAKASGVRVGKVPIMTTRGTFMVEGKEYNLPTQLRLGYGIFVHKTGPGDIVTQFNVDIGIGFKLLYDPEKKIFQINARGKTLGLLPILITLGVSHDDLRNSWGAEVYDANVKKYPPVSFKREITKGNEVFSSKEVNDSDLLKSTLKSFTFDPDINKASIGMKEANLSSGLILTASKKMLMVQEGKEKPIDRDSLQYKYVIGTNEYFDERIRAAAANAKQRIISKLKKNGPDIEKVFEFDYMTGPIIAMLKKYTQVSYASQQNPLSWLGDRRKVTIVGTGGIEDARQLTPNALRINPSTFGFIDPVFTPDGDKVGALNRVSSGTYIRDKKFWKQVYDLKAKKVKTINHIDLIASTWAAGDEYKKVGGELKPINAVVRGHKDGVYGEYKPSEIDYVVSTDNFFNEVVLNLPFVSNNQGLRVTYGAKMVPQALPLKDGEVRLVRPMVNNIVADRNIDVGRTIAQQTPDLFIQSPVAGTVSSVNDEEIQIKDSDGKKFKVNIYNYMPLNEESFINHTATVKVGDKVKKDQVIAESPFTKGGDLSIGVHLRSAYLPFRGQTIDDSVVISETAAKKMTSLHLYQFDIEYDPDTDKKELSFFKAQFPTKAKPKVLSKLGADGIVKAGEIVESGDYLAIKVRRRQAEEYNSLSKIHRSLIKPWVDMSLIWEEDVPGKVVRIISGGDSVAIHISTEEAMLVGDKLTGSAANKATVGAILPDGEMPMNSKGQYMELLMSPATIPSRINPGQIIESAAAKVSEFTGKPMDVEQFDRDHVAKKVYDEMKGYGIEGKEELTLGNRKMKAFVGPQYIMKLEHQSRKKGSARYQAGYDANMQPTKTDGSPAGESMDTLTLYSLIGHDANANLRDALRKGEKNVDMWSDLEMGRPIGGVKVPYTFNKMFSYLEGAGVKVNKGNGIIQLLPATDKDIMAKSSGEITNSNQVYGKNLKPITGGLYDLDILGGLDNSSRNAHINLPSKIPNPLVVEYLAPVLKLKTAEMEDIAREKIWINVHTREVKEKKTPGFLTGWPAFKELIKDVNIDQREEELTKLMGSEKNTTKLSGLIREKRILNMLKANHMELSDMFLSKMLILPSALRPIYISGTGEMVSSEMNKFYKNTILATQKHKELADMGVAEDDRSMKKLRSQIYDEYKAYQGLVVPGDSDPVGILRHIKGRAESKHGFFWSKVVNRKQDLSGHAVIGPDINLGVDDIVLPKEQAWKLFDPFTLKKMIAGGYNPLEAKKHLVDHDDIAYKAMLSVAKERPVLINRNPSLHKFNLMAVNAEIRDAKQIKLNPIVHKLFNLDFDGDTASIYVPVSNDAVAEAKTMYPSTTLWHPGTRNLMMEVYYDGILGLYKGSPIGKGPYKSFSSLDAAIDEYEADKLSLDSNVSIGTVKTTLGRYWINSFIPTDYRRYDIQFDKKNVKEILDKIGKGSPVDLPTTIKELQKIGVKFATEVGATIGIEDLIIDNKERDKFFGRVKTEMAKGGEGVVEKLVEEAKKMINSIDSKNEFMVMMNSGTKGDVNQVGQMLFSPLFVSDHEGKIIKTPITGSYSEGLSVSDYLNTMPGSRLGAIAKKKEVSEPGYLNKLLVTATADEVISMRDCGTTVGISMDVDDPDSEGRVLSKPAGAYHRGVILTPNILTDLKKKKIKTVDVRSSVKCIAPRGICQMCYGIDEYGAFPTIGRNVGMIAAQSISEPLSQGSLSLFHSAGTAMGGTATMSLMDKTMHLLKIPQDSLADATLSKVNGRVTNVSKVAGGGSTITVKGTGDAVDYFIHPSKVVSVKKGDIISRGDKLSGGELNFRDYFGIVGKDKAQTSMVNELSNAYIDNGNKLDKRVFEVVTKAMTNSAIVKDPGSSMVSIKNDVVPYNFISFVNKSIRNKTPMELNYAMGYSLGKKYGRFDKGEIVTAEVVSGLRNIGIKEVIVDGDQVKMEPSIQGIVQIPQRNFDILEKMPGEGMVENLVKGIVSGIYAETGDPFQKLQRYITGKI
jgi:DNA-directed RNA polymerase subunit beta'